MPPTPKISFVPRLSFPRVPPPRYIKAQPTNQPTQNAIRRRLIPHVRCFGFAASGSATPIRESSDPRKIYCIPTGPRPDDRCTSRSVRRFLSRQQADKEASSTDDHLAHLVEAGSLGRALGVGRLEAVLDLDVEVALVLLVGPVVDRALDLFAGLDREHVLEVEDGLLPVRVLGMWPGGEADGLVAGGEVDVEPGDEGVDVVVSPRDEVEGAAEGQVGGCAGVEVEREDGGGVGDDGLDLDRVDEGLREGRLLEWGVVEPVDVVPDCAASVSGRPGWDGEKRGILQPIFSSL